MDPEALLVRNPSYLLNVIANDDQADGELNVADGMMGLSD